MMKSWEERIIFLQAAMKKEFEQWDSFAAEDNVLKMKIVSFTHIKNNYRIKIVTSWKNKYIEITVLEKIIKNNDISMLNGFLTTKKIKFTIESQSEDILRSLQSYRKEIELKEVF